MENSNVQDRMNSFSNRPDWVAFGYKKSTDLARTGTDFLCEKSWIQRAYAWFYHRLPESLRTEYKPISDEVAEGPPSRFVPFPCTFDAENSDRTHGFEAGCVAFVAVDSNGSAEQDVRNGENDPLREHAYLAARYVYDIFRKFDRHVGFPQLEFAMPQGSGTSMSLAVMMAALCRILRVELPNTVLASGCFENAPRPRLKTVEQKTLYQKITAAVRYGYRKFFLVENQKGMYGNEELSPSDLFEALKQDGTLPTDASLEFIEVSEEPTLALFRILRELPHSEGKEIVEFLAAFSNRFAWENPHFQPMLETLSHSESVLVRHAALDMLCRCALHRGRTVTAEGYRSRIPSLKPSDYPFGPLGSYLKYEEAASRAILKLDLGIWGADDPDHRLVERILERQKGFIEDHIADIEDIRIALASANTKARRLFFLGRLKRDPAIVLQAWQELTAFQEYWTEIFDYTQKQELSNETLSRQQNQCVECMADYWHLTQQRLPAPFLPNSIELSEPMDSYTLTACVLRSAMNPEQKNFSWKSFLELADRNYAPWHGYPNFLPYEKMLIYQLGTEEERAHARNQLSRAFHLAHPQDGIMALLALRTAWLLKNESVWNSVPEQLTTPSLREIADELRKSPDEIVYRCPY